MEGSPAYRDSGDAGALQAVRIPKPITYSGTVQVVETGSLVEVFVKYGDKSVLIWSYDKEAALLHAN
jgi:hypothetical protein